MLEFGGWLQSTPFFTALRESWYAYPVVLALHVTAIALFGGLIAVTNLRLLGVLLRDRPAAELIGGLRGLKHTGFTLLAACGLLIFGSKAQEYLLNPFFHAKLGLLLLVAVHAWVFRKRVYQRAAEFDAAGRTPPIAKLAAALSLLLWIALIIAGRGIGYIQPDLDRVQARLAADRPLR